MSSVIYLKPGKAFDLRIENAKTNADDEPFVYDADSDEVTYTMTNSEGEEINGGSFNAVEGSPGEFLAQTTAPEVLGSYRIEATVQRQDAENSREVYLIVY